MSFLGQGPSLHSVVIDAPVESGGNNAGPRPTELLLMAVAGCTGIDVVSILRKMQVEFMDLEILIGGTRMPDHPRYYTSMEIVYRVTGDSVPREKVERAAELSLSKYCTVSQTLLGRVHISHRVEILAPGA